MAAILSTNMASLYAQKNLSTAQASLSDSVQRLSSGTRINSAKDDAAGYGISESIKGAKNVVDQNIRNAKDGISWAQTAEGALDVVGKILQRALTLTTQSLDQTLNNAQQASITAELVALNKEITDIGARTKFQGGAGSTNVFDTADAKNVLSVNTGAANPTVLTANLVGTSILAATPTTGVATLSIETAGTGATNGIYTNVATTTATGSGSGLRVNYAVVGGVVTSVSVAEAGSGYDVEDTVTINILPNVAVTFEVATLGTAVRDPLNIQNLINTNSTNRAALGAGINSLEYAVDNMQTLSTNLADGISRIVDTDYAAETSNLTRTQILQQAATSMLAQANQMPNVILTLLK